MDLPNVAVRSGQLWTACDGCAVGTIGGALRPSWNESPTENEMGRATSDAWEWRRCVRRHPVRLQRSCCYTSPGARAVRRTGSGSL